MKYILAMVTAIALLAAIPAPAEATQSQMYTRGKLNANMCTSSGKICHPPIHRKFKFK